MSQPIEIPTTTADILKAFEALVARRNKQAERIETKAEAAARIEDAEIARRAVGYTEETIVNRLAALQLEFGGVVSGLKTTVDGETVRRGELGRAIEVEVRRLAELREITIAAEAVAIRAAERAARDAAFETDATAARKALDDEIMGFRGAWSGEAEAYAARIAEEDTERTKRRARAEADFEYETARTRTLADHAFAERKRDLERSLAEQGERMEKAFVEREAALDTRADEIAGLRDKVAGFPATLEAKVTAAREAAFAEAKAEAEFEARLAEQEGKATLELKQLRVQSLEATIARQTEELSRLQTELAEVLGRTQTMAADAIGSARG